MRYRSIIKGEHLGGDRDIHIIYIIYLGQHRHCSVLDVINDTIRTATDLSTWTIYRTRPLTLEQCRDLLPEPSLN